MEQGRHTLRSINDPVYSHISNKDYIHIYIHTYIQRPLTVRFGAPCVNLRIVTVNSS